MPYIYLCCIYYSFIVLLSVWHDFAMLVLRTIGNNGIFILLAMSWFFFFSASLVSVRLSWQSKRWFPVLMHQGVFWGLFAVIFLYIIPNSIK